MTIFTVVYVVVAVAYLGLALGLFVWRRARFVAFAAGVTSVWAASFVVAPPLQDATWFLQATGWLVALNALERRFSIGHGTKLDLTIRVLIAFGVASAGIAGIGVVTGSHTIYGMVIEARLFFALTTLILIENIFRNAGEDIRWHVNLPLIAIATMAVFTFLLYGDAIIHQRLSPNLITAQAIVYLIVLPLFIGTERRMRRWRDSVQISHGAAFYTSSLILGGSVLVALGATGSVLRRYGSNWGAVLEIALVFAGIVLISILASSGSARSRLRNLVVTNFFAQRYDYRLEWLRCIETLAAVEQGGLPQRVIKVMADTIDSPCGVLMLRNTSNGALELSNAGEWNMRGPSEPIRQDHPVFKDLAQAGYWQAGEISSTFTLDTTPRCWLAFALPDPRASVPLGIVLLGVPRVAASLNDEAIALLKVVAREISLMLAERRAAEALAEARRFAAAGQRFAFVAHDIKNIANQLALLVSNADHHIDDPAFRDDMMATLRGSVGKIQTMLTRLKSPDAPLPLRLDPARRLRELNNGVWSKVNIGIVLDIAGQTGDISMEPAGFDAVMNHLIDNAIEASAAGEIISVRVEHDGTMLTITITDRGVGMTEAFVRDELFRPFTTSKASGYGLGAFQARELVHAAGGKFSVSSSVGAGTVIKLAFPLLEPVGPNLKLLPA